VSVRSGGYRVGLRWAPVGMAFIPGVIFLNYSAVQRQFTSRRVVEEGHVMRIAFSRQRWGRGEALARLFCVQLQAVYRSTFPGAKYLQSAVFRVVGGCSVVVSAGC